MRRPNFKSYYSSRLYQYLNYSESWFIFIFNGESIPVQTLLFMNIWGNLLSNWNL